MQGENQHIIHTLWKIWESPDVRGNLDKQLARYLRKARGGLSYAAFSKRVGISHTTFHRLENGEHHLTLNKLEVILNKLKVRMRDVFPNEF